MARVLLVANDTDIRETISCVLEEEGHDVTAIAEASRARILLRTIHHPLVVLLCQHPDVMDTLELLADVIQDDDGRFNRHSYRLLSTQPQRAREMCKRLCAWPIPVMAMPFDIDELLCAVEEDARRLRLASLEASGCIRSPSPVGARG